MCSANGFLENDGDTLRFADAADLAARLSAADMREAARRSAGLRDDKGERYALTRFLLQAAQLGDLTFPLTITKSERPDFTLVSERGNWGIEVTQTTTTEINRDIAVARRKGDPGYLEYTPNGHMMVQPDGKLRSEGLSGHADCRRMACLAAEAVQKKLRVLNTPGYTALANNVLLLLDTYGIMFGADELPDLARHIGASVAGAVQGFAGTLRYDRICFVGDSFVIDDLSGSNMIR